MNWQPIETAPKDGRTILLCGGFTSGFASGFNDTPAVRTGYWYNGKRVQAWYDTVLGRCPLQPTHWMPLPDPPTTTAEEGK